MRQPLDVCDPGMTDLRPVMNWRVVGCDASLSRRVLLECHVHSPTVQGAKGMMRFDHIPVFVATAPLPDL